MDPRHSQRIQAGLDDHTFPAPQTCDLLRWRQGSGHVTRGRDSTQEGSNCPNLRVTGGLYQSGLPSPKVGRTVINLKAPNRFVVAPHFKMESIRTVKNIIREGDWMAKLDLKDASRYQRFLQFKWNSETWQFRVLPFGLNSAPHAFTKLLKPVVAEGVILYLDDMLILAEDKKEGRKYLATVPELLVTLGFIISIEKSMFDLTQSIDFLRFLLDSWTMTISLPGADLGGL